MELFKKIGFVLSLIGVVVVLVIFATTSQSSSAGHRILRMAHAQAGNSEIGETIAMLSKFIKEESNGTMEIQIFDSGVLGTEKDTIEMVQAGVLDMAKVGSNTLAQFRAEYSMFSLPYLFVSQQHYYDAMRDSKAIHELFDATYDDGYVVVGYYANGSRNYYLKDNIVCDDPSDLKGKKIRSTPSSVSMEMISLMGGSPVPMSAGETYTALQQGVVDGAENTELALSVDGHMDLVKSYTYTEHQYSPDLYLLSSKVMDSLSDEEVEYLRRAVARTNENFVKKYNAMMEDAIKLSQEHGVTIYRNIDKSAFIKAVAPMHTKIKAQSPEFERLYNDIQSFAQ